MREVLAAMLYAMEFSFILQKPVLLDFWILNTAIYKVVGIYYCVYYVDSDLVF
jgi:hypothetical protein